MADPCGQVFPTLFWQIREIRCLFFNQVSPRDALFHNFQLAGRGAIRKPPNLVDWVHSLRQLEKRAGDKDTQSIIRTWNGQCTQALQIVGRKAQALKNLWGNFPEKALDVLTEMVSTFGWEESGWTEEGLASKRILPGYVFRCTTSKSWTARQTVTKESCVLMLERIHRQMSRGTLQGKLVEKNLAERAQQAAVVHSIEMELLQMATIPVEDLEEWKDNFLNGDAMFDLEISSAMLRHDGNFMCKEIPSVKALLDKHAGRIVGSNNVQVMSEKVRVQATELEESTYQLLCKQMDYDVEAFRCYLTRVSNVEMSIHHKKEEWMIQAHNVSQEAAQHWWDGKVSLMNCEQLGALGVVGDYKAIVQEVSKRHSVLAEQVVPVAVVNWTSPCQINTQVMKLQADLLAEAMSHKDSIGLVLMPQWAYKQNEIWLAETAVMNLLMERKLRVFLKWALMFQEQTDTRDKRSLAYDGRILVPEDVAATADKKGYLWQGARVMRGRTELAKQLAAKNMVVVEDFRENALPMSTADRPDRVKGAAKASQLGEDAMQKVLDAVMEGPEWGAQQGKIVLLIMDINPGVANLLDAMIARRGQMRMPVHYLGLAENHVHFDWVQRTKLEVLRQKHFAGELTVPGRPQPSKEMPADLLETPPAPPTLSRLAVKERDAQGKFKPHLIIPKDLMDTWGGHEKFKDEFMANIAKIQEELGEAVVVMDGAAAAAAVPDASSPAKRNCEGDVSKAPSKRPRVLESKIIDQENMVAGQDMFKVSLLGGIGRDLSKVQLVIKPQHRIYIVNQGGDVVELQEGFMVAGFGKGKFKFQDKEPDANPATHIPYELSSGQDKVLLGTKLLTVHQAVREKKTMEPTAKLCYYNMEPVAGGPVGAFNLQKTHAVLFGMVETQAVDSSAGAETVINRLGALIPANFWKNHCMGIFWVVKWTPSGLQPVRPLVCLSANVTLPPGKALDCS